MRQIPPSTKRNKNQTDGAHDAKVLACKLIDTCRRSGASPSAVISALSVVLGMVIGNVAEDREVAEIAIDTIHRAIAAGGEDDSAELLQ
jgi:thymidine phosphorylase